MNPAKAKQSASLEIEFRRTGERRYGVIIHRSGQASMEMNPAPGFDPLMPHDLLHFIVESELGLQHGIFGQIADGGDAGTFTSIAEAGESGREAARRRRRTGKRGEKLLGNGRQESAQSERATGICWYEWLARSDDPARKRLAAESALQSKQVRNQLSAAERQSLDEPMIRRICARMNELSDRWSTLDIGQSLRVTWPGNGGRQ